MSARDDPRRDLAIAALEATASNRPPGRRPAPEEIRHWLDGRIAPARAAEIDAHVAHDPDLHAEWLKLRRAALADARADGRAEVDAARGASPRRARSRALIGPVAIALALAAAALLIGT